MILIRICVIEDSWECYKLMEIRNESTRKYQNGKTNKDKPKKYMQYLFA